MQGVQIKRVSRSDKEFHFQKWFVSGASLRKSSCVTSPLDQEWTSSGLARRMVTAVKSTRSEGNRSVLI